MAKEITYINGGEIYKQDIEKNSLPGKRVVMTSKGSDGVVSDYWHYVSISPELDDLFQLKSTKTLMDGTKVDKIYFSTKDLRELLGMPGGKDIIDIDISPDINLVIAIGEYENNNTFSEFYFNVENFSQIEKIANYYNLPSPISIEDNFDSTRDDWILRKYNTVDGNIVDIVAGSIAFDNDVPTKFKLYKSNIKE